MISFEESVSSLLMLLLKKVSAVSANIDLCFLFFRVCDSVYMYEEESYLLHNISQRLSNGYPRGTPYFVFVLDVTHCILIPSDFVETPNRVSFVDEFLIFCFILFRLFRFYDIQLWFQWVAYLKCIII